MSADDLRQEKSLIEYLMGTSAAIRIASRNSALAWRVRELQCEYDAAKANRNHELLRTQGAADSRPLSSTSVG